jgi:peroxiredoxin
VTTEHRGENVVCRVRIDQRFWAALLLLTGTGFSDAAPPRRIEPGTRVEDFSAKDSWGKSHALSQIGNDKIVVLAFLGVECPLAKLYVPRLADLARKYESRGVVFLGVDSNRQDSIKEIGAFARRQAVPFPVLKDLRQKIADGVRATRTPEVVVIDKKRILRYRGRIDDQFGFSPSDPEASYRRTTPVRHDLAEVLDAVLAGKPVAQAETATAGCLIGRDREPTANPRVTYCSDVAPILNKHCLQCHRTGELAPFPLTSFAEAAGWADMIAEVTRTNRMPPWHADEKYGKFSNDARLSDREKQVLLDWAESGSPEGNPSDLPVPPTFAEGWMIPEPDEVHYMSDTPFEVPATGVIELKTFIVDPGWKEDRWISSIEPRPGNRSIVHHILVYVLPPGEAFAQLRRENTFLGIYAPGLRQEPLAPGLARFVRAGSRLVFNVHYTPNGSPQKDRSFVGIKFAHANSVRREVLVSAAINRSFTIPPGAPNHEVRSSYRFKQDAFLLTMLPHMHLRGKDFLYQAIYPDGTREPLLSVPRYDFDWPTMYRLAEPKFLPAGTWLSCVAHYDNSEDNLNNPNPKTSVSWGEQVFDEMMIGFFEAAPAHGRMMHDERWLAAIGPPFSGRRLFASALVVANLIMLSLLILRSAGSIRSVLRGSLGSRLPRHDV